MDCRQVALYLVYIQTNDVYYNQLGVMDKTDMLEKVTKACIYICKSYESLNDYLAAFQLNLAGI
jgi:predicted N-acyltransferase